MSVIVYGLNLFKVSVMLVFGGWWLVIVIIINSFKSFYVTTTPLPNLFGPALACQ